MGRQKSGTAVGQRHGASTAWAPARRRRAWILSSQEAPRGYAKTGLSFSASNFPEFEGTTIGPTTRSTSCADAFAGEDPELEAFAGEIRDGLIEHLAARTGRRLGGVHAVRGAERPREAQLALAAIQGTLRMSGAFSRKAKADVDPADAAGLVESVRIYTMFPQMPSPMPSPTATPEELKDEMATRAERMRQSGRDPHTDRHGRVYTHISTPNVSNTIHGVYLTLDATGLLDDIPPALDLFGTKEVEREWVLLQDLKGTGPCRTPSRRSSRASSSASSSRRRHRAALRGASSNVDATPPTLLFVVRTAHNVSMSVPRMRAAFGAPSSLSSSCNFRTFSMTLISVDVVSAPQKAAQSLAISPALNTSEPRFTVPAMRGTCNNEASSSRSSTDVRGWTTPPWFVNRQ